MDKQLYIPDKIKVGFQKRGDTYTKKLAYVIYYDLKGELRKEKSWESWRDKQIDPLDFPNNPTDGFVLNKKVGGHRSHWNFRDAHVRVYDPRDFEFEISVANLLYILSECDCSRGKGLEGKFVYAWDKNELILLPSSSEDYKNSKKFTVLQTQTVKSKELVVGASYLTKKQEVLTYLGRFDYHTVGHSGYKPEPPLSKKYIFWNGKDFVALKDLKNIAAIVQPDAVPDLAELQELYYKSPHGTKVVALTMRDIPQEILNQKPNGWHSSWNWIYEDGPDVYVECYSRYKNYENPSPIVEEICTRNKITLKDGGLIADSYYTTAYAPHRIKPTYHGDRGSKWVEPTGKWLWATLESGSEYRYTSEMLLIGEKNGKDED